MTGWRAAQIVLAGFCLAAACAASADAMIVRASMLGQFIFGSPAQDDRSAPAPPVARYVSDQGQTFVLDRSSSTALMKFEDSPEVLALSPTPAARGDTIYRNDMGEPVLRITRLGGLTVFIPGRPAGAPVAFAGQAPGIRLAPMGPGPLLQRLAQASIRASRAAKHLIVFDAQEVTPGSEAIFADAAFVTSQALVRLAGRRDGESVVARIGRVLFAPGSKSSAVISHGVLNITVNPSQGLAGRPSSARIVEVAGKGR
ncbi:MAG TPA: DUF4908 domain-containing protein [Caulobacteraceae bacterium]